MSEQQTAAMRQALEALDSTDTAFAKKQYYVELEAMNALRQALEQHPADEPVAWNKRIRDSVDLLLAQAGYAPDSSARHQLACMNFDFVCATIPEEKTTNEWESARVGDFNHGWNDCRKAMIVATPEPTNDKPVLEVVNGQVNRSWDAIPANFTGMLYTRPQPAAREPLTPSWISKKDQMPPEGVRVFWLDQDSNRVGYDTWMGEDFRFTPSHWMPIPSLTK